MAKNRLESKSKSLLANLSYTCLNFNEILYHSSDWYYKGTTIEGLIHYKEKEGTQSFESEMLIQA